MTAYWTLRAGYADLLFRRQTQQAVAEATQVAPGNAAYHARLAELDGPLRRRELEEAVARNPYYAPAWIELGLLSESEGDYATAERHLLEAARVDHTLVPRWSLASFYFRRHDEQRFWEWARKTEEMSYADTTALYRLCWRMSDDPVRILDRAIPNQPDHLARYLLYLLKDGRVTAGPEVGRRLVASGALKYKGIVVGLVEQLLIARDVDQALAAWNDMAARDWIPYPALAPEQGRALTNGDFRHTPCRKQCAPCRR